AEIRESMINDLAKQRVKQEAKKKRELNKSLYTQWKNAFNLKNTNEPFIPKFAPEVKEALEGVLHGEQIKLTQGSLYKLVKRSREELLPYIRPTLESADAVVKQVDNALIFVKDLEGKKYFTSVARNDSGEWVIASNAPKTLNNIQNKIKGGGEVLYSTLPELPIIAKSDTAKALNSEVGKAEATKPALKNQEIPLDQLDQRIIKPEEFTPELIKQLKKNPKQRVMIGKASEYFNSIFANDTRNFNITFYVNGETINYILKNHGANAAAIKQGKELPISIDDIINYPKMLDEMDYIMGVPRYKYREPAYEIDDKKKKYFNYELLGGKQFKDHYLIIECTSHTSMALTNMYKVKGNIKDSIDFKPPKDDRNSFFKLKDGLDDEGRPAKFNLAFGRNFKKYYHDPKGAIAKLLETKEGQVAGAFYREDLGDIDLVWGEIRDQKGNLQGYGLSKIVEKHLDDFSPFEGNSAYEKLGNGLEEIVSGGELKDIRGIKTIHYKKHNENFKVGLSQGWDKQGNNYWIITAYKVNKPPRADVRPSTP
ncbi:PBECR2 nuclease fold domain-containing protein, partial [Helicobacter suis]|uniref:putative barnase/colicin E5 family endoribonuclease n=1 Tax=Helicobacter suis TaxID=104628 RepID=UPI0023DDA068